MENYPVNSPENNSENSSIQTEYPSFEEHMAKRNNEFRDKDDKIDNLPNDMEKIKSPEQRQVEDLEVLFSFCDEKDTLDILKSDSYGTLLSNNVSLVDLFNANALFDEQYYDDGYSKDYDWRGDDDPNNVFHLLDIDAGRFNRDKMTRVKLKRQEHDRRMTQKMEERGVLLEREEYDEYWKRFAESNNPDDDIIRANEAKETISEIASIYFSDDTPSEKTNEIKNIIKVRSNGEELSEDQKTFLKNEHNIVADRLLYDGHVINEERANNILNTLRDAANNAKNKGELEYRDRTTLMNRMVYAESAINDFVRADRVDLVYDAQKQLEDMVDEHFDILVSTDMIGMGSDIDRLKAIDNLVFGYSNPYLLAERAKKFDLCNKEYDWMDNDKYVIDDPDRIVDYIGSNADETLHISKEAKLLKELGASDEAILRNCHNLSSVDFIDAESFYDGSGSRLVEAGIDKDKIIKEVFSSTLHYKEKAPFEKENYPFKGKSRVEALKRNGFDMTDIAKTFSPDDISKNLTEFIEQGADAKELVKYMASYREEFEGNIVRDAKGEISGLHKMHFDGVQNMMVWDENHPEGKMVEKEGMRGDGIDYVAVNLDILADNGVTEKDIFSQINGKDAAPFGMFIPKMLESRKFDVREVLNLGHAKYTDYLKDMEEAGFFDKEYVEMASDVRDYASKIVEELNGSSKERRDRYYQGLTMAE